VHPTVVWQHVSKCRVCPVFYVGGPTPRALGIDHVIGAVPRGRLSDGCMRGGRRFEVRCPRAYPSDYIVVYKCDRSEIKRGSDTKGSEASGGKTHTKQVVMGRMFIHGHFSCTFEPATYTLLLLTIENWNHGGFGNVIYFGTGGRQYVSLQKRKKMGAITID
jgi:hypothetical protein